MTDLVSLDPQGDGVLLVRLNRPEKKNALTGAMYEALTAAFREADAAGTGAIVVAGSGGAFCAGNDIADFAGAADLANGARPAMRFIGQLARTTTPLVAAVEGVAVGIGTTMLLHCDLAYAAPGARFRMPFVDLGLVPEAGSSYLLPRRVGTAKAAELLLLGDAFEAGEALRLGLLNGIVEPARLEEHALAQAARLAAKPRAALATTRRLLRGDRAALEAAIAAEAEAFAQALATPEAQAAFEAFLSRAAKPGAGSR